MPRLGATVPLLVLAALAVVVPRGAAGQADGGGDSSDDAAQGLYDQGLRLWRQRDPGAWLVLRGVPPETPAGLLAAEQLARADSHYRLGLDQLVEGDDDAARQSFERGLAAGPMDPHYYVELADIYRNRGLRNRAVAWYGRYLAFVNRAGETLPPEALEDIVLYIGREGAELTDIEQPAARPWRVWLPLALLAAAALLGLVVALLRRGRTLDELVEESPDLHPRIAYAVGCLRHELLKHRLGAIGDAVAALRAGRLTPSQLEYLQDRLYGGDSLGRLWGIYLETFDRLGGRSLNLRRRDREFRRAGAALKALEGLRGRFASPDAGLAERLEAQREQIALFDRHLRTLSERLTRARIDGQLLREAVFSVQGEHGASSVHLDEIRFVDPPPDVHVEVFRSDLLIILRNLVRNAIHAIGEQAAGRRAVGLEVALRTEPTGDESVLLRVLDTSPEPLTTADVYGRRLDHGLGLVAAAVTRYDGSVFVEPVEGDWSKAVVVRLFRALGESS